MRKLLFYLDYRSRSGAQRVMVELANYFAEHGDSVTLACQFQSPEEGYSLSDKINEVILPKPSSNKLKRQGDRIKALCNLCQTEQPDLIISFLIICNMIAIKVGNKLNIPVLISVRNDPGRDGNFIKKLLIKHNYPKASGCVFQTEEAREYFNYTYPTKVIMNPLSKEILESLDEVGISKKTENTFTFISLGRLEPQKRHDVTIRALSKIKEKNVILKIFGKGPLESSLKELAIELGVKDRVIFAGVTSHVAEELLKADAFVMASDYEGMPNALMEAMAAGLPCIVTDCPCGGPKSLIVDGENGFLVEVGNYDDLSEKMKVVIDNPLKAKVLGEKAKSIKQKCDIENVAPQWAEMFDLCRKTR